MGMRMTLMPSPGMGLEGVICWGDEEKGGQRLRLRLLDLRPIPPPDHRLHGRRVHLCVLLPNNIAPMIPPIDTAQKADAFQEPRTALRSSKRIGQSSPFLSSSGAGSRLVHRSFSFQTKLKVWKKMKKIYLLKLHQARRPSANLL